ncbi:MAG TPA: hypothetical protein VGN86_11160 [Pyrinomonadaceae bacterium]|nr:hypothetical protein [Pyrinomonadaceae bacterium]
MTPDKAQGISFSSLDVAVGTPATRIALAQAAREPFYLSARNLLVLVFLLIIFAITCRPIIDPDFWWHLKTGQYLFETRTIPHTDIFSAIFAGREWVTHEWLSEVFIYAVYRISGLGGLIVSFSLIVTAAFALIYKRCADRANHVYVAGASVLLGSLAMGPTMGVRPQIFTFLLAGIFLKLLEDFQKDGSARRIWLLVPLMAIWVNLHAGFGAGIVIIVVFIAGISIEKLMKRQSLPEIWRGIRSLLVVFVACLAAIVFNPNGVRIYSYPFETLTSTAMMRFIEEWRSPNFHQAMFQPLALLIVAVVAALALSRRMISAVQLLLLIGTAWAMLRSGRNVPFFVLVATPLLAERAWSWMSNQRWARSAKKSKPDLSNDKLKLVLNILLLLVIPMALVVVRARQTLADQSAVEAQKFPGAGMEFIRANKLPQPLYNEYHWGGYLIWKLYPDYKVFIDGRADVYGDAFFEQFMAAHAGEPGWRETLTKYHVRTVLVAPDSAIASLLRQDQSWKKVFEDTQAVIFVNSQSLSN